MGEDPRFRKSPAILPESHIQESPAMSRRLDTRADPRTSSINA
jgi:hypothetical protein